jgi:hypothetical protein
MLLQMCMLCAKVCQKLRDLKTFQVTFNTSAGVEDKMHLAPDK